MEGVVDIEELSKKRLTFSKQLIGRKFDKNVSVRKFAKKYLGRPLIISRQQRRCDRLNG